MSTSAAAPALAARRISPAVRSRSRMTYTWNHQVPPAAATTAPTSSIRRVLRVLSTYRAPALAAPAAVASSPSGWAIRWKAVGATPTGVASAAPSRDTDVSVSDTSRSTRGASQIRCQAFTLARSVRSLPDPVA